MKKLLLLIIFFLIANLSFSQSKIDSLIKTGIKFHDEGKYENAIKLYKEALELDPREAHLNYEIALSSLYLKDYKSAIQFSDIILGNNDLDKDIKRQAIITKGSALDYQGKTNESIELFEEGLKKYGPDYLLYYNLGVDYYTIKKYKKAEEAYISSIKLKRDHPGSHYMLGKLMNHQEYKCKSLLSLFYFLYLEPNTERSKNAFNTIYKIFNGDDNITVNKGDKEINIKVNVNANDNDFVSVDFLISMFQANNLRDENKYKTKAELLIENTKSFIDFADKKKNDTNNLWNNFYIPFLSDISKSDYLDIFCYFISISSNENAVDWLEKNIDKVKNFEKWLKENNK